MSITRSALLISAFLLLPFFTHAQTTKVVLFEEFTGDWCGYCPWGADTLKSLLSERTNVKVLAHHGGSSNEPMRTPESLVFIQNMGISSWPSGMVDRVFWNMTYPLLGRRLTRSVWRPAMNARTIGASQHVAPLSLNVSGSYHESSRIATIQVTGNVLVDMPGQYNLNVVLSEDSLNHTQRTAEVNGPGYYADPYYHLHVVRHMITGPYGIQITGSGFASGHTIQHTVSDTLPAGWDVQNMHVTVFVEAMDTTAYGDVMQTWQEPLLTALTVTPVTLISFNAACSDGTVELSWITESEQNNAGWSVERLQPDGSWSALRFIRGGGTTSERRYYNTTDTDVLPGGVYTYRLKQVDYDGSYRYSPKATVDVVSVPATVSIAGNAPNPFHSATALAVDLDIEQPITVEVVNLLGQRLALLHDGAAPHGRSTFIWSGTDAMGTATAPGIYIWRVQTATRTYTGKMLKLR